jgi:hypothetical protein
MTGEYESSGREWWLKWKSDSDRQKAETARLQIANLRESIDSLVAPPGTVAQRDLVTKEFLGTNSYVRNHTEWWIPENERLLYAIGDNTEASQKLASGQLTFKTFGIGKDNALPVVYTNHAWFAAFIRDLSQDTKNETAFIKSFVEKAKAMSKSQLQVSPVYQSVQELVATGSVTFENLLDWKVPFYRGLGLLLVSDPGLQTNLYEFLTLKLQSITDGVKTWEASDLPWFAVLRLHDADIRGTNTNEAYETYLQGYADFVRATAPPKLNAEWRHKHGFLTAADAATLLQQKSQDS